MKRAVESPAPGAMVATIQIPDGAFAAPALVGAANAAHVGMTPALLHRVLGTMRSDPVDGADVVVLSRRPLELAAPPAAVVRFLRKRTATTSTTPTADPANDGAPVDEADLVRRELGLARPSTRGR